MSTILYNTNSSLIQKFQRGNKRQNRLQKLNKIASSDNNANPSPLDIPFDSEYPNDSFEYLQELCCSCLPISMHKRVTNLNNKSDLEIYSLISLTLKNFISTWYGVKIPTEDDQFQSELFNLTEKLIRFLEESTIDSESLLLDDIPALLSTHIKCITNCDSESIKTIYEQYCSLSLHDEDRYPYIFTTLIQNALHSDSILQNTFVDAASNKLILGRVFDSISEPYYVLRGILKLCEKIKTQGELKQEKASNYSSIEMISKVFSTIGKSITYMSSVNQESYKEDNESLIDRFIFQLVFVDILKLNSRKPYFYSFGKTIQYLISKSIHLNYILHNFFNNYVKLKLFNKPLVGNLTTLLRHTLYPNDNQMGPRTIIPTGKEFEALKINCSDELFNIIQLYKLDIVLGISKQDLSNFVETICLDKRCNKILLFRLIDSILANIN